MTRTLWFILNMKIQ